MAAGEAELVAAPRTLQAFLCRAPRGRYNKAQVAVGPATRVYLGSPDPRSVSSRDVDLHTNQPDPPNQCGCRSHEARREALRNRLLQKQSRRLAERRVSDPLPPGPDWSWWPEAAYLSWSSEGTTLRSCQGRKGKTYSCCEREQSPSFPSLAAKPSVPFLFGLGVVCFALMLSQRR